MDKEQQKKEIERLEKELEIALDNNDNARACEIVREMTNVVSNGKPVDYMGTSSMKKFI